MHEKEVVETLDFDKNYTKSENLLKKAHFLAFSLRRIIPVYTILLRFISNPKLKNINISIP